MKVKKTWSDSESVKSRAKRGGRGKNEKIHKKCC